MEELADVADDTTGCVLDGCCILGSSHRLPIDGLPKALVSAEVGTSSCDTEYKKNFYCTDFAAFVDRKSEVFSLTTLSNKASWSRISASI